MPNKCSSECVLCAAEEYHGKPSSPNQHTPAAQQGKRMECVPVLLLTRRSTGIQSTGTQRKYIGVFVPTYQAFIQLLAHCFCNNNGNPSKNRDSIAAGDCVYETCFSPFLPPRGWGL
jgi:hypothetical protein